MSFKLSLITLVYSKGTNDAGLNVALLQKANSWLQRRGANVSDDLLLIGAGFADEADFQATLKPYGLADAEVSVIPLDELNPSDGIAVSESVELIAERWISKHHDSAIPVINWLPLIPDAAYADEGWWWVGLEAGDAEQLSLADILVELLPDAFKKQALTWATIMAEAEGLSPDGEMHEVHEAAMLAVALARWLTGFNAATENIFYNFSASDAIDVADLDALRLGFEAGQNHESELSDYFDGNDESDKGLAGACLLACLDERMGGVRSTLSDAFGGNSLLFWSLYRCIWPDLNRPSEDSFKGLVGLRDVDIGDIERPWRFVTEGWIEFTEEWQPPQAIDRPTLRQNTPQ